MVYSCWPPKEIEGLCCLCGGGLGTASKVVPEDVVFGKY